MAPFEALYDRPCRSPMCWAEVGEKNVVGPDFLREMNEKVALIIDCLRTAQSRQKCYAYKRRRYLEFAVGVHVFFRVSPKKGLFRFGCEGNLAPRFIGLFEILDRVGEVSYHLALPPRLSGVHDVFHVSMLRKYEPDPSHVVDFADVEIEEDATYVERPIRILDRREQVLRGKTILLVRVLWHHHDVEESTWEREALMLEKYPFLFT